MRYFAYCRKSTESEERQALSVPAQIDEIRRHFGDSPDIEIVDWFEEKMSAKAPGRPVYGAMIARIEQGEAEGIIAWHPDRLARNSVDGGWIIYLLDRKILKTLKFVSYQYEQSPEGMFMLQIMFGQSKYYVDTLSVNVKRGMRKKVAMGWLPNLAPLGYRNERGVDAIVCDPDRFPLLRKAWELLLTGAYSVRQIRDLLNNSWGFRTPLRAKTGGRPVATSTLYKIFSNPFYAGILNWYGEWRVGKHEPMVTLEEFRAVQRILDKPQRLKPEKYFFAFAGLIKCSCGLSVTAEKKIKPSGRSYVYYHCTRRLRPHCVQKAVRAEIVEAAICDFLRRLEIPGHLETFLVEKLAQHEGNRQSTLDNQKRSNQEALKRAERSLDILVDLRIKEQIEEEEFKKRRSVLQEELFLLRQAVHNVRETRVNWLELGKSVILFRKYAANWFSQATEEEKRLILRTVGSNSCLADKKLSIDARFPFKQIENPADCLYLLAIVDAIETDAEKLHELTEVAEAVVVLQKHQKGELRQAA